MAVLMIGTSTTTQQSHNSHTYIAHKCRQLSTAWNSLALSLLCSAHFIPFPGPIFSQDARPASLLPGPLLHRLDSLPRASQRCVVESQTCSYAFANVSKFLYKLNSGFLSDLLNTYSNFTLTVHSSKFGLEVFLAPLQPCCCMVNPKVAAVVSCPAIIRLTTSVVQGSAATLLPTR